MNAQEKSKKEYIARINKVMDYIERNLDQPFDLNFLANIASFSPFHFHRIFTFLVGETPNNFLQRIRIEKAAQLLRGDDYLPVSEISGKCGFNNVSSFSRSFRKYFGSTATDFRLTEKAIFTMNGIRFSKNGKVLSKDCKKMLGYDSQFCGVEFKHITIMNTKIEVKQMPELEVVYCRHTGAYNQIYKAYDKLMKWAGPRGLLNFPETKTITVYHDDPAVTAVENIRQSAAITVKGDVKTEGEIGKMTVDGGKYAVGRFEIGVDEFQQAWNTMCLWFTESGYQQGDGNPYELYYNDHTQHPEQKFILDICIPVKPL